MNAKMNLMHLEMKANRKKKILNPFRMWLPTRLMRIKTEGKLGYL